MRSQTPTAVLGLLAGRVVLAQRPGDQSICDYYAVERYGSNSSTTQFQLIESIVGLAYVGGGGISGTPKNSTGIFNTATFDGSPVYLRPWFDGSEATTNLNDEAVGIDWLDGGGLDPIISFLNNSKGSIQLKNETNQYRLFNHWFSAFGRIYGCTLTASFPVPKNTGGPVDPAYVHKFMNLNSSNVGYFINQFTVASQFYGFSAQDARTLDASLNAKYNIRCSPESDGKLYSICQNDECPLYQPSPDCNAYKDIRPMATGVSTSSPSGTATGSAGSGGSSDSGSSGGKVVLSGGEIAGIAIGGAAILLFAFGLWLWHRRQKAAKPTLVPVPVQNAGQLSPAGPSQASQPSWTPHPHPSTAPSSTRLGLHDSYISSGTLPGVAPPGSPGYWVGPKTPQEMGDTGIYPAPLRTGSASPRHVQNPPRTPEMRQGIAEMESPDMRQWQSPTLGHTTGTNL